jgi:2-polyprenyl-3-methyl-5-hydroxy-6-metoxy-1,4-benzoquinol methylase
VSTGWPAFDLVLGGVPRFEAEAPWAWRLLSRYARQIPARCRTEARGRIPAVAHARGQAPILLVHADPEAYLLPEAAERLLFTLQSRPETDVVLPVSNEPWSEEARASPPFLYLTPSQLAQAVAAIAGTRPAPRPCFSPRSAVYAVRRHALEGLSPALLLEKVPEEAQRAGRRVEIDPSAYLHRYGEMDGQAREDLAARVPSGARSVLDVGCSRGATVSALRKRGVTRVVGIEPDPEDAEAARLVCDRVIAAPLEEVREEFGGEFDAVLFGDVLEHLVDPSAALARVRPWLSARGVVVASVPNVGHWAVLADLIEGRFDYVPYSLLSGTHLRFFTRRTLHDLLEASGYRAAEVETVTYPPPPQGEETLARLAAFPGTSEDLLVAEFIVIAEAV